MMKNCADFWNQKKNIARKNIGKEKSGSKSVNPAGIFFLVDTVLYVTEQTYPPSARTGYAKTFLRTGVRKIIFARTP